MAAAILTGIKVGGFLAEAILTGIKVVAFSVKGVLAVCCLSVRAPLSCVQTSQVFGVVMCSVK